MINKQKLWFLTLFTLILVLSIYYITMPTEIATISEDETFITVEDVDDEYVTKINELEKTITDSNTTIEEKNNAYELMNIEKENKTKSEALEEKIKDEFDLNSDISIENEKIIVSILSSDNSYELANNIIICIQKEFDTEKDIVVKFK